MDENKNRKIRRTLTQNCRRSACFDAVPFIEIEMHECKICAVLI